MTIVCMFFRFAPGRSGRLFHWDRKSGRFQYNFFDSASARILGGSPADAVARRYTGTCRPAAPRVWRGLWSRQKSALPSISPGRTKMITYEHNFRRRGSIHLTYCTQLVTRHEFPPFVRDPAAPKRDEVLVTCGGLCPGLNNVIRAFLELRPVYHRRRRHPTRRQRALSRSQAARSCPFSCRYPENGAS
jgi:hypothetical protein